MVKEIIISAALLIAVSLNVSAQSDRPMPRLDDTTKPYLQNPGLPAFNILEMDSSTVFNTFNIGKGKVVALVLFDPDCHHCQHMMKNITASMDSIKDVQFYFFTLARSIQRLHAFYEEYHLKDYSNIVKVGRDSEFFFLSYFKTRNFPAIALYDKHKKFITVKEGTFNATDVYNMLHQR